jgi:hypothetical protein
VGPRETEEARPEGEPDQRDARNEIAVRNAIEIVESERERRCERR